MFNHSVVSPKRRWVEYYTCNMPAKNPSSWLLASLILLFVFTTSCAGLQGTLCLLPPTGFQLTKIPLSNGARSTTAIPNAENYPGLDCGTCSPWKSTRGFHIGSHYAHLAQDAVFILGATGDSCDIHTVLALDDKCSPAYLQRATSDDDGFYVICSQLIEHISYNSSADSYEITVLVDTHTTSPLAKGVTIVQGKHPGSAVLEDYIVYIEEDTLQYTSLSYIFPAWHFFLDSDCYTPTAVDSMAPAASGKPRALVTCNATDNSVHRLKVTLGDGPETPVEAAGEPVLSPGGEYLLNLRDRNFRVYRTSDSTYFPGSNLAGDILEARFHEGSNNRLFLSIATANSNLQIVNVDTFFTSGGTNGTEEIASTSGLCEGGQCLPHGLVKPGSDVFFLFVAESSSITARLYDMADLSRSPQTFTNIDVRPAMALVVPAPTPSTTPTTSPSTSPLTPPPVSSTPSPQPPTSKSIPPSTSLLPPNTPSSTPSPPTPPSSQTPSPSTNPTPDDGNTDNHNVMTTTIAIAAFVLVAIVIVVLILVLIVLYRQKLSQCLRRMCEKIVKPLQPIEEIGGNKDKDVEAATEESGVSSSPSPKGGSTRSLYDSGVGTRNPTPVLAHQCRIREEDLTRRLSFVTERSTDCCLERDASWPPEGVEETKH